LPIHVENPVLGPGAQDAAEFLVMHAAALPDHVIVIFTKNISASEGRTGVGVASATTDLSDEQVAEMLRFALASVSPNGRVER
jgi:hypothetical protein